MQNQNEDREVIMNKFEFRNPVKIIFGPGTRKQIGSVLSRDFQRALVLVGKGPLVGSERYVELVSNLATNGIRVVEMDPIDSNPRITSARKGALVCRKKSVDVIIALGGGSTMDCAKIMAGAAAMGVDPERFIFGERVELDKSIPTVMIPTIAATGTEVNNTAVMRDEVQKLKNSCGSDAMYPLIAFVDPELADSLPKHVALHGAFDILSHTFEYYFNGDDSIFQNRFSEGILLAVMDMMEKLAKNGYEVNLYGELMWSAIMTWGTGLTRIGRGLPDMACHTIEEGIGAYLDTHHGAGLAVLTPLWMELVYERRPDVFARFARNVFGIRGNDDIDCAKKGVQKFTQWCKLIGLPQNYCDLGIAELSQNGIATIIQNIFTYNNTVGRLTPLSEEDVQTLLSRCFMN